MFLCQEDVSGRLGYVRYASGKAREPQAIQPLIELQVKAAALLADGCTNERVAAELGVPLDWMQSLEQSLPVTAEVVHQQWRKYQAHGQRIRSLMEQAMDVVETELEERPTSQTLPLSLGLKPVYVL